MEYLRIPKETSTQPIALPRFLEGGREEAVLVLHGFKGMTENLRGLIERLNGEGFTVSAPRLPGHGTCMQDLHLSGWRDWVRRSIDAYEDLRASHRKIYVTGLSMGGVLSLLIAALFDVERIALCAPAVKIRNRLMPFTPILRYVGFKVPTGHEEKSEDPQRQYMSREYWSTHSAYTVSQLYHLQRYVARRMPRVEADTLTIVSKADESVSPEVADYIEKRISSGRKRRIVLENSPHVMTEGDERERIFDEISAWFGEPRK